MDQYQFILYASYFVFPFLLFLVYLLYKKKSQKIVVIAFMVFCLLFIYVRFVERHLIFTHITNIDVGFKSKLVVISDLHIGVFKDENFLQRVVNIINKIDGVDAVLIAGDFTFYPKNNLTQLFSPLKDIKVPVYGVYGNHDSEKPGPPIQKRLKIAIENNGVILLHNTSTMIKGTSITLLGLGDKWAKEDDISKIDLFAKGDNLIVLTHNPETAMTYKNSIVDLTIAGHTHGGQIRIPYIYQKIIPSFYEFDRGLYELMPKYMGQSPSKYIMMTDNHYAKVFVTTGIGEVILPMRFGVPPTIEILELN